VTACRSANVYWHASRSGAPYPPLGLVSPGFAAGGIFPSALSGPGGLLFAIVLLVLSLALIFYGRSIIKALAFLVAGLAGGAFGLAAGGVVLGPIGAIVGGLLGFVIGGLIGLLVVHLGMGLALGYFGYLAVHDLTHVFALAVVVGVVLFLVGVAISSKLLELVTALVGGFVLYGVLVYFGAGPLAAGAASVLLAFAGFFVQQRKRRRGEHWRQM
jgi:hypothetical protein